MPKVLSERLQQQQSSSLDKALVMKEWIAP